MSQTLLFNTESVEPRSSKTTVFKRHKKVILGSMQKKNYLKILWILELSMTKLCHFELNLRLDNEKINFSRPRIFKKRR